ncbi:hypothetical protein ABW19_dt0209274 [Dactylella cylindrospora]|nr:hypothetical protein ABW19_dt0209274 [Dactylella cylindrospora]
MQQPPPPPTPPEEIFPEGVMTPSNASVYWDEPEIASPPASPPVDTHDPLDLELETRRLTFYISTLTAAEANNNWEAAETACTRGIAVAKRVYGGRHGLNKFYHRLAFARLSLAKWQGVLDAIEQISLAPDELREENLDSGRVCADLTVEVYQMKALALLHLNDLGASVRVAETAFESSKCYVGTEKELLFSDSCAILARVLSKKEDIDAAFYESLTPAGYQPSRWIAASSDSLQEETLVDVSACFELPVNEERTDSSTAYDSSAADSRVNGESSKSPDKPVKSEESQSTNLGDPSQSESAELRPAAEVGSRKGKRMSQLTLEETIGFIILSTFFGLVLGFFIGYRQQPECPQPECPQLDGSQTYTYNYRGSRWD